jgi:hypothetical protein
MYNLAKQIFSFTESYVCAQVFRKLSPLLWLNNKVDEVCCALAWPLFRGYSYMCVMHILGLFGK